MVRPIGWSGKAASAKLSKTRSSGVIERGADLLEDDVLLAFEFLRVEDRVRQDVAEDIEGERNVVLEHPGVVGGGLDAGRGIDLAADLLDLLGDFGGGAGPGALEGHVLEQVGQPVLLVPLRARAGADPDAERGAFKVIHFMRDDSEAGFQNSLRAPTLRQTSSLTALAFARRKSSTTD